MFIEFRSPTGRWLYKAESISGISCGRGLRGYDKTDICYDGNRDRIDVPYEVVKKRLLAEMGNHHYGRSVFD